LPYWNPRANNCVKESPFIPQFLGKLYIFHVMQLGPQVENDLGTGLFFLRSLVVIKEMNEDKLMPKHSLHNSLLV
jgi:hypothetical protein